MEARSKITIGTLRERKRQQRKISMITCYDHATARLMEEASIDSLLVGDTYAEVCLGHSTTLPATMDHLVTLADAVRRGAPNTFLVGDMPFLSYQVSREEALRNAGRFLVQGGCDCIKLEVDRRYLPTVEALATAGIPVMAHLGLKPQSIQSIGGYKVQGKTATEAVRIIEDARLMEQAGAVALLVEAIPVEVAQWITDATPLPVIGIASGPHTDGQVVVLHDMLGYGGGHPPRSVKRYANLYEQIVRAFRAYSEEVVSGAFPTTETCVRMDARELAALRTMMGKSDS